MLCGPPPSWAHVLQSLVPKWAKGPHSKVDNLSLVFPSFFFFSGLGVHFCLCQQMIILYAIAGPRFIQIHGGEWQMVGYICWQGCAHPVVIEVSWTLFCAIVITKAFREIGISDWAGRLLFKAFALFATVPFGPHMRPSRILSNTTSIESELGTRFVKKKLIKKIKIPTHPVSCLYTPYTKNYVSLPLSHQKKVT